MSDKQVLARLSARVSEEVMGIKLGGECDGEIGEQPVSPDGWFCFKCGAMGSWGDTEHEVEPRPYASSIAFAWDVIERLKERGLRCWPIPDWHGNWQAMVYRKADFLHQSGWHNEAAEAICEVALLASEDGGQPYAGGE